MRFQTLLKTFVLILATGGTIVTYTGCSKTTSPAAPAPRAADPAGRSSGTIEDDATPVGFGSCLSHSLEILVNQGNSSSKEGIVEAFTALSSFPKFAVTHTQTVEGEIKLQAASGAQTEDDARELGWYTLQTRLQEIDGVVVTCGPEAQDGAANSGDDRIQDGDDKGQDDKGQDDKGQDDKGQDDAGQDDGHDSGSDDDGGVIGGSNPVRDRKK